MPLEGCLLVLENLSTSLFVDELREHLVRIDGDENPLAASECFVLLVQNLRHVDVGAALQPYLTRLDSQRFVQRYGLQVVNCYL